MEKKRENRVFCNGDCKLYGGRGMFFKERSRKFRVLVKLCLYFGLDLKEEDISGEGKGIFYEVEFKRVDRFSIEDL